MKKWTELTEKEKLALMLLIDDLGEAATEIYDKIFEAVDALVVPLTKLLNIALIERLAELEHEQWSHWMNFFFSRFESSKVNREADGVYYTIKIDSDDIVRWERLMNMNYKELSDLEKDSDRKWAKKVFKVLENFNLV